MNCGGSGDHVKDFGLNPQSNGVPLGVSEQGMS